MINVSSLIDSISISIQKLIIFDKSRILIICRCTIRNIIAQSRSQIILLKTIDTDMQNVYEDMKSNNLSGENHL